MSHFAVAVFTNDADPDDTVERALAPFHEFECTGHDDQYVVDLDITEDVRKEYNNPARTRSMVRLADETLLTAYDPSLWRRLYPGEQVRLDAQGIFDDRELEGVGRIVKDGWGGEDYHARTPHYPDGAVEVDVQVSEIMTLVEFTEYWHGYKVLGVAPADETKYGWVEVDGVGEVVRIVNRTNCEKWSWIDAKGREIGRTTGDEIMPGLRPGETTGQFCPIEEGSPGEIHLLSSVYDSTKQSTDAIGSSKVASVAEIRNDRSSVPNDVGQPAGSLSDLSSANGTDERQGTSVNISACGSLPPDQSGSGTVVSTVQSSAWGSTGQPGDTSIGDSVSFPVTKHLIGGSQWDWWVIGGRYSERLFVKPDTDSAQSGKRSWGMEDKPDTGGVDSALLADLDWDRMTADKIAERRRWFQQEYPGYQQELEKARFEALNHGDADAVMKVNQRANFMWGFDADTMETEDDYVGVVKPLTVFAALYKGTWNESGKMGWWGMVSDEKDAVDWNAEFQAILEDAKKVPTMRMTIVDCHI